MGNKFDTLLDAFTCVAVVIAVLCSLAMIGSVWGATGDMRWEVVDDNAKPAEIRFWLEGTGQEFTMSFTGAMPLVTCPACPDCPPCPDCPICPPCQNEVPEETETSVTLAWDANDPSENVEGYNIYRGLTSGSYDTHRDAGNVLTYTWNDLADNVRYYFAATAYRGDVESDYSNEVNWISNTTIVETMQIPTADLNLRSFSSEEVAGEDARAFYCIDGDLNTMWHTRWSSDAPSHPHEVVIDVGSVCQLTGMEYIPRSEENGRIAQYEIYVSMDEVSWTLVKSDTFPVNFTASLVNFSSTEGRYVKFVALSEVSGNDWAAVAELNFYKENR